MILLNSPIGWHLNILNLFNVLMVLNKCIFRWFSMDVDFRHLNMSISNGNIWLIFFLSIVKFLVMRKERLAVWLFSWMSRKATALYVQCKVVHWCGRLEGSMAAGRGVKSRACLLFGIYYAQTPNPKEKAKKPKLILCPTNCSELIYSLYWTKRQCWTI